MTWEEFGVHTSMTERRADDASRDVVQWLKCFYMQDKVGEVFTGTISGVASFGLFVTLDGLNIDGLLHVTELPRDYFHFDAVRHALVGERTGRIYQLAGRVSVRVARVDLDRAKIDFTLAPEAADAQRTVAEVPGRPMFEEPLSPATLREARSPRGRMGAEMGAGASRSRNAPAGVDGMARERRSPRGKRRR
jgi:predicted RNA-binding protein with RPS1 domain